MSEDRFEEFLGPYLLGELSVEEERELERHLEGCSGCRGELARARQTHDLLRELAAGGPPPPELRDHVLARAGGGAARSRGRWRLWVPAAVLLVVAVLGAGLLWTITADSSDGIPLTATVPASEGGGEISGEVEGETFTSSSWCGICPNSGRMNTMSCGTPKKMGDGSAAAPSGRSREARRP